MKQHKDGCNSISVRYGHEILATASDDGNTIITNLVSYRHEVMPHKNELSLDYNQDTRCVKHVVFLDPFQCLLSIDVHGCITFYGVG
jgi:hypothetical protein